MKFCEEWLRVRPKISSDPDEAEFERVYQALKEHKAVCADCQNEDEALEAQFGRMGKIPILLLSEIADAAMEKMKAAGSTMGLDSTLLFYGLGPILQVLQDWKLITWNEPMLHVREEWAKRFGPIS